MRERSGLVVECFTWDRGAAGSSLTSVAVLCPWARHIYPCLELVQPRKTHPYINERLLMGRKESNQTKQNLMSWFIYVTGPPPARPHISGPHPVPPQVLGPPPPSLQPIPGLPPPRPPDMSRPPPPHMWRAPGPPPPFHTFPPGPRPGPFVPEQGGVRMIMVPKVDPVIVNINSEGKCRFWPCKDTC